MLSCLAKRRVKRSTTLPPRAHFASFFLFEECLMSFLSFQETFKDKDVVFALCTVQDGVYASLPNRSLLHVSLS